MKKKNAEQTELLIDDYAGIKDLALRKKMLLANIQSQRQRLTGGGVQELQADDEFSPVPVLMDAVSGSSVTTELREEERVTSQRTTPNFDADGGLVPPDVPSKIKKRQGLWAKIKQDRRNYPRSKTMKILLDKNVLYALGTVFALSILLPRKKTNKDQLVTVKLSELRQLASNKSSVAKASYWVGLAPLILKAYSCLKKLNK